MFNKKLGAFIATAGIAFGGVGAGAATADPLFGSSDFDPLGFVSSLFGSSGGGDNGNTNAADDNYNAHDSNVVFNKSLGDIADRFFAAPMYADYSFGAVSEGDVLKTDIRTVLPEKEDKATFKIVSGDNSVSIVDGHTLVVDTSKMGATDGNHVPDKRVLVRLRSEDTDKEYRGEINIIRSDSPKYQGAEENLVPTATFYGKKGQRATVFTPVTQVKDFGDYGSIELSRGPNTPNWFDVDSHDGFSVDLRHAYRGPGLYTVQLKATGWDDKSSDEYPLDIFIANTPKFNVFIPGNGGTIGGKKHQCEDPSGSSCPLSDFSALFESDDVETLKRGDLVNEGLLGTDKQTEKVFRDAGGNAYKAYKLRKDMDKRDAKYAKLDKAGEALDRAKKLVEKIDEADKKLNGVAKDATKDATKDGDKGKATVDGKVTVRANTAAGEKDKPAAPLADGTLTSTADNDKVTVVFTNPKTGKTETIVSPNTATAASKDAVVAAGANTVNQANTVAATPAPVATPPAPAVVPPAPAPAPAPASAPPAGGVSTLSENKAEPAKKSLPDTGANVGLAGVLSAITIALGGAFLGLRRFIGA